MCLRAGPAGAGPSSLQEVVGFRTPCNPPTLCLPSAGEEAPAGESRVCPQGLRQLLSACAQSKVGFFTVPVRVPLFSVAFSY